MILKGKVVAQFPGSCHIKIGDWISALPVEIKLNEYVEVEVTPILTSGAAAGNQLQLPFAPAK